MTTEELTTKRVHFDLSPRRADQIKAICERHDWGYQEFLERSCEVLEATPLTPAERDDLAERLDAAAAMLRTAEQERS